MVRNRVSPNGKTFNLHYPGRQTDISPGTIGSLPVDIQKNPFKDCIALRRMPTEFYQQKSEGDLRPVRGPGNPFPS